MNKYIDYILQLLSIADTPNNTDTENRQHSFLIYMGLLMSTGGLVWGTICLYHDIYIAATVPFTYIMITMLNFTYLYFTKNFEVSQNIQIVISLFFLFSFSSFLGASLPVVGMYSGRS